MSRRAFLQTAGGAMVAGRLAAFILVGRRTGVRTARYPSR
jgi:hypothetical protein